MMKTSKAITHKNNTVITSTPATIKNKKERERDRKKKRNETMAMEKPN